MTVFISYSKSDEESAKTLKEYLESEPKPISAEEFHIPSFQDIINPNFKKDNEMKYAKSSADFMRKPLKVYSFLHSQKIAGTHFPSVLKQKIKNSKVMIILWGHNSFFSQWVNFEIEHGNYLNKIMVPVILDENVQLPSKLAGREAVLAYKKPDCWIYDVAKTLSLFDNSLIKSRLDLDKKFGNRLTTWDTFKVYIRDNYGLDIDKLKS